MSVSYPGLPSPVSVACTNTASNKRWGEFEARVRHPTYIRQAGGSWRPHSTKLNPVQNNQPPVYSGQIQCMLVPWVTTTDRLHCTTRGCLGQPVKGAQLGLPGIVGTVMIYENGLIQRGS